MACARDRVEQWFPSIPERNRIHRGSTREQQRPQGIRATLRRNVIAAHARTRGWSSAEQERDALRGIEVPARIAELAAAGVPTEPWLCVTCVVRVLDSDVPNQVQRACV